jgi:hypothetical protein
MPFHNDYWLSYSASHQLLVSLARVLERSLYEYVVYDVLLYEYCTIFSLLSREQKRRRRRGTALFMFIGHNSSSTLCVVLLSLWKVEGDEHDLCLLADLFIKLSHAQSLLIAAALLSVFCLWEVFYSCSNSFGACFYTQLLLFYLKRHIISHCPSCTSFSFPVAYFFSTSKMNLIILSVLSFMIILMLPMASSKGKYACSSDLTRRQWSQLFEILLLCSATILP